MESGSHNLIELFFDGEAAAEERAIVLRLLEQSPEARSWLAELEQMRSDLASLPHQKAPQDVVSAVLRRAEQELLAQRHAIAAIEKPSGNGDKRPESGMGKVVVPYHAGDSPQFQPAPPEKPNATGRVVSRHQLWVAMAVAAVALVVVVLPNVLSRNQPTGIALHEPSPSRPYDTSPREEQIDSLAKSERESTVMYSDVPKLQPAASHGNADGLDALSQPLNQRDASAVNRDKAQSFRKARREAGGNAAKLSDEATAQEPASMDSAKGRFLEVSRPASIAYVYDVATPEAQKAVLETFENTLREQQIALEDSSPQEGQASPIAQLPLLNRLNRSADTRANVSVSVLQNGSHTGRPTDCVYVVEATPLQLTNTISALDNLSPRGGPVAANAPVAQTEETQARQLRGQFESSQQGDRVPSLQRPAQIVAAAEVKNSASLSQAIRLPTEFDAPATNLSASKAPTLSIAKPAPAEQPAPAAKTAPVKRSTQLDRQQAPEPVTTQELRRAVIIFRVVPQ